MPRDKDRKRIIRSRMKKTGESYTAARAHVISRGQDKKATARRGDHAALAGMSDDTIRARTGRTWQEWERVLDAEGAASLAHRDIALLVHERHGVGDWWTQTVTVGYERIKGLRERGQRRGGAYEASKSKTFSVPVKKLFEAWANDATRRRWLEEAGAKVRSATAPKSMRLQWPDGTVVTVWFTAKTEGKSAVAVAHTKLRDQPATVKAKTYWAERLDALASVLAART
jgi:hypothetical protein